MVLSVIGKSFLAVSTLCVHLERTCLLVVGRAPLTLVNQLNNLKF